MDPWALIDLHCDTLTNWSAGPDTLDSPEQAFSLSAVPPGVRWAQFFAVYIPDRLRGREAVDYFERGRAEFLRQMEKFSARAAFCRTAGQMEAAWAAGKVASFLTVENGSVFAGDLARVELLRRQGVRCVTLTWNGENEIGSGHDTAHGLSAFGREVVPEMERQGILVDASHLNDAGFEDLLQTVRRPFLATHSNARAVCGHKRNLTDDMIREMAARRCLIGLNYHIHFLRDGGEGAGPDDLMRHIERFFALGAEHILALGSDFDGADLPEFLNTPAKAAGLCGWLLERGVPRQAAEGILFRNARTFFEENLA